MEHPTPAALLEIFLSGLEEVEDAVLVYGPGAELAGRVPAPFDASSPSMFLDFTMADFVAMVEFFSEVAVDQPEAQLRWAGLPPDEVAVRFVLLLLQPRWTTKSRSLAPGDRHFRLLLRRRGSLSLRPLNEGGPTTWLPPLSGAFTAGLRGLASCGPWSLDQLQRYLRVLGGRRQLERFALLGAWPVDARRFVCVLSQPTLGAVGLVVEQDPTTEEVGPVDVSVRRAAEEVVLLELPEVLRWREQGWEKDGIAWNTDPDGILTPWSGHRPPRPDDPLVRPEARPWPSVMPPSLNPDPWSAALQDLQYWVEQPMWASTRLSRRAVGDPQHRIRLRWAAGWVVAPDCFAHVDAVIWSPDPGEQQGAALRGRPLIPDECALPGQRYLRVGEVTAPSSASGGFFMVSHPQQSVADHPPQNALRQRVGRDGIAWADPQAAASLEIPLYFNPGSQAPLDPAQRDRMARLLHEALDHPTE